ncbi:TetR/AcrR family transcriptional regulator [Streptosporangium roseum]|uniref:Transcriptional regulator, TetR family n=1 Tax=Streptosporangium roseum (strain ATCC 12428 / DSM 43021 / JCM 3005 / KCTC 9067 / NCIMB 10171 / NRRL 2505 / NI 9100) TaxID=479432 RepID=D2BEZ6_STRRD|nr:TetR/AcrR family transcriptional regulator [Streptosporangium roseum]ACZ86357.1 putative transcriptional regulator, TetR family [Streptosporangium roseum DSM 43021]
MTSADGGQRELILRVATRLFAALGYDATSISQIAEAAGLDVATITQQAGGKRELYLTVMDWVHETELASLHKAVEGVPVTSPEQANALVCRIIDQYLDLCVAHPEIPALWMHRWLSDASDVTELELRYTRPMGKLVKSALAPAIAGGYIDPDVDMEYLLWSMLWCVNGFSQSGVLDEHGNRRHMDDPEVLRRFRALLHRMIHRTVAFPGDPP